MAINFLRAGTLSLPPTSSNEGATSGAVVLSAARLAKKARAVEAAKVAAQTQARPQELATNSYNRTGQTAKPAALRQPAILPPPVAANLPARVINELPPVTVDAPVKPVRQLPPELRQPIVLTPPAGRPPLQELPAEPIILVPGPEATNRFKLIQELPIILVDQEIKRSLDTYPPVDVLA